MRHNPLKILLVACLLFLVQAACNFGSKPAENNPSAPTQQLGAETTKENSHNLPATPILPQVPVQPEQSSGGPGAFNLEDPSAGLSALTSYRQSLVLAFDGTVNGLESHSKTSLRRSIIEKPTSQFTMQAQVTWLEINDQPQQMFAKVGDGAYQQTGADGRCGATSDQGADNSVAVFNLHTFPVVRGAEAAGDETINGVASKHYTFDERALGQAGQVKAKGEVWVAVEGGYVVKYLLRIEGEAGQLGPGVAGVQTWEYQLTEPNALAAPDLPKGCTDWQAVELAPLPPEAQNVVRLLGFVEFTSAQNAEQVATFYQGQAETLGWKGTDSSLEASSDTILNYRKQNNGLLSIRIHPQEGGTKVTVQALPDTGQ